MTLDLLNPNIRREFAEKRQPLHFWMSLALQFPISLYFTTLYCIIYNMMQFYVEV